MIEAGAALEDLPAGPGAYALVLRLTEPAEAPTRAFPSPVLTPEPYLYAPDSDFAAHFAGLEDRALSL